MRVLSFVVLIAALVFGATTVLGVVDWADTVHKASERVLGVVGVADTGAAISGQREAEKSASSSAPEPKYIASVSTSVENGSTRYHVRPTRAGRAALGEQIDVAWDQVVARGVPDRAGLRQQFMCHPLSFVARGKRTWDLETWRPTVGLKRTLTELCNPR